MDAAGVPDPLNNALSSDLLRSFAWVGGHADVWRWFHEGPLLARIAEGLARPFADDGITKVAGIEARGFLLGGLVALQLGAGFLPVRKDRGLFPGEKHTTTAQPDYRGNTAALSVQIGSADERDRVLLVDDWIETGSQAAAAQELVGMLGASWVGSSVIVDQASPAVHVDMGRVHALLPFGRLPAGAG